eukprot:345089-Amphidinium_carterae.1
MSPAFVTKNGVAGTHLLFDLAYLRSGPAGSLSCDSRLGIKFRAGGPRNVSILGDPRLAFLELTSLEA